MHKNEIAQTDFFIEQERCITCTRKAITDYSSGLLLTKSKALNILNDIADVESIRYIVLSQKEGNHKINDIYEQYTVTLLRTVQLPPNFLSKLCILNDSLGMIQLASHVLIRLVHNKPSTPNGITISEYKPGSNNWLLNISRPGVLR